ncbi:MAG: UDP-N-acetylmuramoyl-L-alanyl-D-glutamate--2,6-diaminopimelate ligase [Phycisphaerales bacterium]|nr:UDP-N-acetylmuramoyl-L-alanyl-D-glutamate--2,6-diaminopimelate ligase [Phycisphaerales bacterium]
MRLSELIAGMDVHCVTEGVDLDGLRICDLTEDSRTVVPGSLFIARLGTKADGCRYIEPAIQCGCVAVVTDRESVMQDIDLPMNIKPAIFVARDVKQVAADLAERFYGHPSKALISVAITGTNGKTTITHLAHQLIEAAGVRCGLIGTVEIDDGRERARASMTTPPAVELSRTLATMVEHECKAVVMEVSSHAMDQCRVGAIRFDACVFTNLTGDHLDYHQTIEHYTESKSKLFGLLKPDGLAVINADDDSSERMMKACADGAHIERCSAAESFKVLDESITGMTLELSTPIGTICAHVPIFGRYNAMNILQSVLVAQHVLGIAGFSEADQMRAIEEELGHLVLPVGRLEHVESCDDDLIVLVDFAHTDDALRASLGAIRAVLDKDSRLWCIFGCGGDRDATKRPRMGAVVAQLADSVVITSDNPRIEPPNRIIDEILTGIDKDQQRKVSVQSDRSRAINYAIANAASGDVILIAGKGHETEQISPDGAGGTRSIHFDDREHAKTALRERRLRNSTRAHQA